ncbi:Protein of unknown function [Gryllus bimaculatus]|nr:Protein of unknown function [Gryllus bimaculatus]
MAGADGGVSRRARGPAPLRWMALCALAALLPALALGGDICANVRYSYEKGLGSGSMPKDTLKDIFTTNSDLNNFTILLLLNYIHYFL